MNTADKNGAAPRGTALQTTVTFVRKHRYALLISLLFAFLGITNYSWLKMNNLPPVDDIGFHLSAALDCRHLLWPVSLHSLNSFWNYTVAGFYPPLFHICMAAFNAVFGMSPLSSTMTNMFFLALLFAALYGIGRKIGNPDIGLLGSFILTMYPYVFTLMRQPFPDFALLAAVSASFCLLLYTDGFTNRTVSILFGISLGAGMLVKQVFAPFMLGPTAVALGCLLFSRAPSARASRINALCALALGAVITLSWYLPKLATILPRYMRAAYGRSAAESFSPALFSMHSLWYYFDTMVRQQTFVIFSALFAVGCLLFLLRNKDTWLKAMLISPIIGAYLTFFFIKTKENKTTVPYLVFFALITAAGLLAVKRKPLRKALIGLVVAYGIVLHYDVSYGNGTVMVRAIRNFLNMPPPDPVTVTESFTPVSGDWKVGEVVDALAAVADRTRKRRSGPVYFGVSDTFYYGKRPDSFYVTNRWPVAYYYWLRNGGRHEGVEPVSLRDGKWRDGIELLVLSEELEHSRCPADEQKNYRLIKQLPMPDKSTVFLYERGNNG